MTEHDATEVAYKNGYERGIEDLSRELKERYSNIPLWGSVAVVFMEEIIENLKAQNSQ